MKNLKNEIRRSLIELALCNYFGCHGYRLHWHKIPNRPQYAKSILSYKSIDESIDKRNFSL